MKVVLLILACSAIVGCDVDYKHHPDVLVAIRDPMFVEWLRRNDLVVLSTCSCIGCTRIHVMKADRKDGAK